MIKELKNILLSLFVAVPLLTYSQPVRVGMTPEYIRAITPEWKGERFPDGRPKISDNLLERAKNLPIESMWGSLGSNRGGAGGYTNQFEGNWHIVHPEQTMTGRAVTAQYMPARPDMVNVLRTQGISEGRIEQNWPNYWAIDILVEGDIYVADGFGKIVNGTLIGDVLANAIYTNSKRGVVFYGGIRDEEGIAAVPGFNAWVQGVDPSAISGMMLTSLNAPVRIGRATVLPGDLVVAKKYGVLFIPAHLAEEVIFAAEMIELVDLYRWTRLREGRYTLADIYTNRWTDEIKADYRAWLRQHRNLPVPLSEIEAYLATQNQY